MASRFVIPAVVLAVVAGGVGYWVAKDNVVDPAIAAATDPAAAAAPASRTPTAENPKIAEVGGEVILKSDVDQLYSAIKQRAGDRAPAQDQIFWMLVDQIVASRLIIQAATKEDLQATPDVQNAVKIATEQIVQEAYVQSLFKGLDNDAALRPLYDKLVESFKGQEEVRARHILVKDEAAAIDIIKKLQGGAKFEDLAKASSIDEGSKAQGGELGWFSKESMVPEFAQVAFSLSKGQISQTPVKTQFGYHVIEVEDRRPRTAPSYEEVKPQLLSQAQQEKLQTVVTTLRAAGNVHLFAANGIPPVPADVPLNGAAPAEAPAQTPAH